MGPSFEVNQALKDLQEIPGIGRNLSTKLLAMCTPDKYIVVNDVVERALRAFGYFVSSDSDIGGEAYLRVLKELKPFIDECQALGLQPAAALDAFFVYLTRI